MDISKKYKAEITLALKIRVFETLLLDLFSQGKIFGTVHTCVGQEITPVIFNKYKQDTDFWFSNHRGHGHFISFTNKVRPLLAEMMGKTTGISGGIGGSQHLHDGNFYSNGIQGGMTPIAAGVALVNKRLGNQGVSVVYIGDGTLGEGILYETMNLCSLWDLPVIFVLENNKYAQSTASSQTFSGNIEERVLGFGLSYFKANVWNLEELDTTVKNVYELARRGTPVLMEVECYRLNSHSKGDDNRFEEEIGFYKNRDLINTFTQSNSAEAEQIADEFKSDLEAFLIEIEKEPTLSLLERENFVLEQPFELNLIGSNEKSTRINELIYNGLNGILNENNTGYLIGEDICNRSDFTEKPYGGAFKVTKDLSDLYPGRVRNTPISEAAITGIGTGIALTGSLGMVEIMFGDFSTLIYDQILQHASKLTKMYGRKLNLPLIIRTPMGGKRGYGPTHSQSIERIFLGLPSIHLVALNYFVNPELVYRAMVNSNLLPAIVIENKVDYTRSFASFNLGGYDFLETSELLPTLVVSPRIQLTKPDVTIFCYGGMLFDVLTAVNILIDEEIICEVICPTLISPINISPIVSSVEKTGKLFVVEEGSDFASLGSEIIASLNQRFTNGFKSLKFGNCNIIPCSKEAESNLIPNADHIVNLIKSFS